LQDVSCAVVDYRSKALFEKDRRSSNTVESKESTFWGPPRHQEEKPKKHSEHNIDRLKNNIDRRQGMQE
jgi:hypothetical protein